MGLDIRGEKTGGHWHGSYSTLHWSVRYLALKACGLPDVIGERNGEEITGMQYYMHPWSYGATLDTDKIRQVLFAAQVAGHLYPQVLLHSDCDGSYTRRGKILGADLLTGNSKKLLAELESLCETFAGTEDESSRQYALTKDLRDLVKDEVENGSGKVLFR